MAILDYLRSLQNRTANNVTIRACFKNKSIRINKSKCFIEYYARKLNCWFDLALFDCVRVGELACENKEIWILYKILSVFTISRSIVPLKFHRVYWDSVSCFLLLLLRNIVNISAVDRGQLFLEWVVACIVSYAHGWLMFCCWCVRCIACEIPELWIRCTLLGIMDIAVGTPHCSVVKACRS